MYTYIYIYIYKQIDILRSNQNPFSGSPNTAFEGAELLIKGGPSFGFTLFILYRFWVAQNSIQDVQLDPIGGSHLLSVRHNLKGSDEGFIALHLRLLGDQIVVAN